MCKQVSDVHTNIWAQAVCAAFLEKTDIDAYLAGLRAIYRHKCHLMTDGMKKSFSSRVTFEEPQGGLFVWAKLPAGADAVAFCQEAVEKYKIAAVPGDAFLIDEGASINAVRLNFSTPPDGQIVAGIEKLGAMTRDRYGA